MQYLVALENTLNDLNNLHKPQKLNVLSNQARKLKGLFCLGGSPDAPLGVATP
jgi:hypothetical protein